MLAGCSGKQPTITVINQSNVILSNVVASGSGFTNQIGNIAPKTEKNSWLIVAAIQGCVWFLKLLENILIQVNKAILKQEKAIEL